MPLILFVDLSVLRKTRSGQLVVNDVFQQVAIHEMPFNGCGESGCKSFYPIQKRLF